MRIIIIYNKDLDNVISKFGRQNEELYDEKAIKIIETIFLDHGYDVRIVDGNLDMFDKLRDISSEKDRIPFVFNLAYGIQGESRYTHIPSILEMLGLPYFGSGPFGQTLALDKVVTKMLMKDHNIPTPFFRVFYSPDDLNQEIEYPVIVKPAMETSSFGVKKVHNLNELRESVIPMLEEFYQPVFSETFIKGKEFALALFGNGADIEFLPLVENNPGKNHDEIYTSEQKKLTPEIVPAEVSRETLKLIKQQAKHLFTLLRLRDYARADLRMDSEGNIWFLEINSMAGLQTTGLFMAAAKIAGYTYDKMIIKLLDVAMNKYFVTNQKLKLRYESKYNKGRNQF
jgi:D-alanine-D-alanine ligase